MTCAVCGARVPVSERKYAGPCVGCGKPTCPAHTWFYADESNVAITAGARPKCADCKGTP